MLPEMVLFLSEKNEVICKAWDGWGSNLGGFKPNQIKLTQEILHMGFIVHYL